MTETKTEAQAASEKLEELAAGERQGKVVFLERLAEIARNGWYRDLGFSSLFLYCRERLKLSKASAFRRKTAAELIVEFPILLDYLRDERICLTTLCELKDVLAEDNVRDLLERVSGKSEDDVKMIAAEMGSGSAPELFEGISPIGHGRYRLVMEVSQEFVNELTDVCDSLGHRVPSGEFEDVMRECFRVTETQIAKQKRGVRPGALEEGTGHDLPTALRLKVWARDGGCCAFVGDDGRRCGSRRRLEYDHIVPDAKRGTATVDNIRLLCKVHNQHHAIGEFGAQHMAQFQRRS